MPSDAAPPPGTEPRDAAVVHPEGRTPAAPRRRPPQWRMIFVLGAFAAVVYAATEGLLQLAVQAPPAARDGARGTVRASVDAPAPPVASQAPVPAPGPSPGGTPESTPAPAPGPAPTPGSPADARPPPATRDPAAAGADDADTNVEEEAEGGRRAARPKTSDEEAPEFRESADNNISLPVDI